MLYALAISFDLDESVRDDRPLQWRDRSPGAEQTEKNPDDDPAGHGHALEGFIRYVGFGQGRQSRNVNGKGPAPLWFPVWFLQASPPSRADDGAIGAADHSPAAIARDAADNRARGADFS